MPDGHDLVIYSRHGLLAVKCSCMPRVGAKPLAIGAHMLAADAVAAWRRHLYDEGVVQHEEETRHPVRLRAVGSGSDRSQHLGAPDAGRLRGGD